MSGTMTVREIIIELLDQDMDDFVFIGSEDSPYASNEIGSLGYSMNDDRPHGVYLFPRHNDES